MLPKIGHIVTSSAGYPLTLGLVVLGYSVLYLSATELLTWIGWGQVIDISISSQWADLILRQRATFLFEAIGTFTVGPIQLFLSIPNIILSLFLGVLVGLNIMVVIYQFQKLGLRGLQGIGMLIGTIPAILSGAACCVPTIILVIGLQMTATLATIWSFLIPLSVILLLVSLWWSLRKIRI